MPGLFGAVETSQPQQPNPFGVPTTDGSVPITGNSRLAHGGGMFAGINNLVLPPRGVSPFAPVGQSQLGQSQLGQSQLGQSQQGQQAQSTGSIFPSAPQQQQQNGTGLGQWQQQSQQGNQLGQSLNQSQNTQWMGNSMQQQMLVPRQKSIPEQIVTIGSKWAPQSSECVFQHYMYNRVGQLNAPYIRPAANEDERKWEEALAKRPSPDYAPIRAIGFESLAARLNMQADLVKAFNVKLHEIDACLGAMLKRHDLTVSIRIVAVRRAHQALAQRTLALASKVEIVRNRGYAMSADEEDLKRKLIELERAVFDPAIVGRTEEIWARMVSVRERARALHAELQRTGKIVAAVGAGGPALDEEILRKAAKILEDYSAQLEHLRKELEQIQKDYGAYEGSLAAGTGGRGR